MIFALGALALVLSLLSFIGWIWLVVEGFKAGAEWGICCLVGLCCCVTNIVFAVKHWEAAKRPFLLYLIPSLLSMPVSIFLQLEANKELLGQMRDMQQGQFPGDPGAQFNLELPNQPNRPNQIDPPNQPAPGKVSPPSERPDWALEAEQDLEAKKNAEPEEVPTEAKILVQVKGNADEQLFALKQWRKLSFDGQDGARLRMLEALGLPLQPHVRKLMLESLAQRPLATAEALSILRAHKLPEALRTTVLEELCRSGSDDATRVAEVVAEVEETETLLVEETLIRMGAPRKGACARLLAGRGAEWATSPAGRKLIGMLASDAAELEPLVASENEALRGIACDLVSKVKDQKAALKILIGQLKDKAPAVRQRAAAAIEARADPAVTWYLALAIAREADGGVKTTLVKALRALPLDKTVTYLRKLYQKKNPKARIAAIEAARELKNYSGTQVLLRALHDKDTQVLLAALKALDSVAQNAKLKQSISPGLRDLKILCFDPSKNKEVHRMAKRVYYNASGQFPTR